MIKAAAEGENFEWTDMYEGFVFITELSAALSASRFIMA